MNKSFYKAIYQIITTGHWITDQVTRSLKEYEISEPQFNVLRILRGRKGKAISVEEIQSEMVQKSSNVTRIIDKLLRRNFVNRTECPANRRKMDITITEDGLLYLEKLSKKVEELHEPMLKNLTNEELETLAGLIKKLKG